MLPVVLIIFTLCGVTYSQQTTRTSQNNACCTVMDNVWYKKIEHLLLTQKDQLCEGKSASPPHDCKQIQDQGDSYGSGVYEIYNPIDGQAKKVYCDMDTEGGGWTVFQRRINANVSFLRDWDSYRIGFGELTGNHWLGNEILYRLTNYREQQLRVELETWDGEYGYATYQKFIVGSSYDKFRLNIDYYQGNIGDCLIECHNGQQFSSPDEDNDGFDRHCASEASSGWWFCTCEVSNLNGEYYSSGDVNKDWLGISWDTFGGEKYSHKRSEMKIRSL